MFIFSLLVAANFLKLPKSTKYASCYRYKFEFLKSFLAFGGSTEFIESLPKRSTKFFIIQWVFFPCFNLDDLHRPSTFRAGRDGNVHWNLLKLLCLPNIICVMGINLNIDTK